MRAALAASGLSPDHADRFVEGARQTLFPRETEEIGQLRDPLDAVRKAAALAGKMIAERRKIETQPKPAPQLVVSRA